MRKYMGSGICGLVWVPCIGAANLTGYDGLRDAKNAQRTCITTIKLDAIVFLLPGHLLNIDCA